MKYFIVYIFHIDDYQISIVHCITTKVCQSEGTPQPDTRHHQFYHLILFSRSDCSEAYGSDSLSDRSRQLEPSNTMSAGSLLAWLDSTLSRNDSAPACPPGDLLPLYGDKVRTEHRYIEWKVDRTHRWGLPIATQAFANLIYSRHYCDLCQRRLLWHKKKGGARGHTDYQTFKDMGSYCIYFIFRTMSLFTLGQRTQTDIITHYILHIITSSYWEWGY